MTKPLVLGTVQIGMPYGIRNKTGQPDLRTAREIIERSVSYGINIFDTAQGYGNSEDVLGRLLQQIGKSVETKIISKSHPALNHLSEESMTDALQGSLKKLRRESLYGYMLHREEFLDVWDDGLGEIMLGFVQKGMVQKIGVSVYSPKRMRQAIDTDGIALVQIPSNLLDRRFEEDDLVNRATRSGKEVYVRSIFLQGLVLMEQEELPPKLDCAKPVLDKLERLAADFGLRRHEMAMGYVKMAFPSCNIVFGAERPEQVEENVACWEKSYPTELVPRVRQTFPDVEEKILNPQLWST